MPKATDTRPNPGPKKKHTQAFAANNHNAGKGGDTV